MKLMVSYNLFNRCIKFKSNVENLIGQNMLFLSSFSLIVILIVCNCIAYQFFVFFI